MVHMHHGQWGGRESACCWQKTLPRSWYSLGTRYRLGISWACAEVPDEEVTAERRQ